MRRLAAGILASLTLVFAPTPAAADPAGRFSFRVPLITGGQLAGGHVSGEDFRGKILVIDVWASWCAPCRIAAPHFVKLHAAYKSRGVSVFGLSADHEGTSTLEDVKNFIDEFGIDYPIGLLNAETFAKLVELSGETPDSFTIPTTLVLGRDGELLRLYSGYYQGQEMEIENLITSLIESDENAESKN